MSYRTLGFPEYGMTNASNFKRGFTPDKNPKWGNTKMGNKIDIHLSESAKAKQQCHSLPYSVLRIWNDQCKHFKCVALPLTATPKWEKRGNKIVIHLCKRTKVKITDIAYIRVLRVLTVQCKYLKLGFTPDRNPKRGTKKG